MFRPIFFPLLLVLIATQSTRAQPLPPQTPFTLGIASYAFRQHDLAEVIRIAQKLKVKKLALKSVHMPLESSKEEIATIRSQITTAGLELYAGSVIYMTTEQEVRNAFRYAKEAGMDLIVGVPNPELLDLVEEQVKAHDISVAIHNHGARDMLYPDAGSVYPLIQDRDPRIGLCLDVGHTLRLNLDPAEEIRHYADRLLDLQIWDVSSASYEGSATLAGQGVLPFVDILQALLDIEYSGVVSVEYWNDPEFPHYGTAQTMGYIQGILHALTSGHEAPSNTLTQAEKAAGWRLLFDGASTRHWRGVNATTFPASGWAVRDGNLCITARDGAESGNGGDIVTRESFEDFELSWEWNMHTRGGNSGLKYYVQEGLADNPNYGYGLEYQILDDANHPWMLDGRMEAGDYRTVGALYEIFPAENKKLKPLGTWNRSRISSRDGRVEHWLNGVLILSYERDSEAFRSKVAESKFRDIPGFGVGKSGPILLQDHGSEVCFRNIKIRDL